ncbi:MAG: DUF4982 domain-containing protein [Clostridia bacterium]|nr:DUF4982 domain-containing protein [Clostridia bacterium]
MKKINFNKAWCFKYGSELDAFVNYGFGKYSEATGAAARYYDYSDWEKIDLPHDYAVNLPKCTLANTMAGGRPVSHFARFFKEEHTNLAHVDNIGWYRKTFDVDKSLEGKRIFIEFEGVFRDSTVWVNGVYIDRHTSGYTGFTYEISDHLVYGEENSIAVRVDSDQPEGWWYEGAGIYRNVFLIIGEPIYFKHQNTFIKSSVNGDIRAEATLVNDTDAEVCECVRWEILDAAGNTVAETKAEHTVPAYTEQRITANLHIDSPTLWELECPYLYTMKISADDETSERFGVREIRFDKDLGFFLNGKSVKMYGACVHQDFGGVGVALSDNLNRYKIAKLKEMGFNSYRASHNPPSPALLDACDELGFLVMDEVRMFGTSPEALRQMESLVLRDRNHPSVVLWSIGNEEFSVQDSEWSYKLAEKVCRILKSLDDSRPTTYGGSNGDNFTGINRAVDVRGVNYIYNGKGGDWIDQYHANHPEQAMIGTEESSYVLSRGAAKTDFGAGVLDCRGDVTMPWGSTPKGWLKYYEARPFFAGGYIWTGFDYRGEPNPYVYTNFSSSFGTIDLAGIPKPPFYYYKSWCTNEPVLKLSPHWNFKRTDVAPIVIYTNCDEVTLTLNGREIGKYKVEPLDDIRVDIPFESGELCAVGVKDGATYKDVLKTAGKVTSLACECVLPCEREGDIAIVEITAQDKNGTPCPLANDTVEVSLTDGEIVGMCNGDPADTLPEQPTYHEEHLELRTFEKSDGVLYPVPTKAQNSRNTRVDWLKIAECREGYRDDFRHVAYFNDGKDEPTNEVYTTTVSISKEYEYIEFERFAVSAEVYLGGKLIGSNLKSPRNQSVRFTRPYRFYTKLAPGEYKLEVRATLNKGITEPFSGYVRLGRRVADPVLVNLHYGKARVFIKSKHPESLKAKIVK